MIDFTKLTELADQILADTERDEGPDMVDAYEDQLDKLSKAEFFELGSMLDLCPIHRCDIDICYDDDPEQCRNYRRERDGAF